MSPITFALASELPQCYDKVVHTFHINAKCPFLELAGIVGEKILTSSSNLVNSTTNSLPVSVTANRRLTGTMIEADNVFINGQWKYQLFDNCPRTWFDCADPSGGWAGLDLGTSYRITKVAYYPRATYAWRMTGGRFQGCNVADFSRGVVTLCTIGSTPPERTNTIQSVTNTGGYRYVRYIGPTNGYCNVAELQFYGVPTPAVAPVPPALQTYLKFDESSGTTAVDATGNDWNGTLVNGATWVAGHNNNVLNLDGARQYVTLPSGVVSNLDNFSITAWVKLTNINTWSRIFDFGMGKSVYMFLTPQNGANNTVRFAITTSGCTGEQVIDGTAPLPANVWTHVAVTLSGGVGTLYANGVVVGVNNNMTLNPASLGNTTANQLGKSKFNDPYFNGQIDEFRIYNRALTASEISTLIYLPTTPTGLKAVAGDSQATLTWNRADHASGYNVKMSTTVGGPYSVLATNLADTTFTCSGLTNGTLYYFVVAAANALGESDDSMQANARPVSLTSPKINVGISGDQFQLNWPADHTGWRLQMSTNLNTTNWQDVSGAGAGDSISVSPTNSNTFFRLIYP